MLINSINVKNFRSYINSEIKLSDKDITCVIGANGSGKSSIIEMITTALFYRNNSTDARGSGMEELINRNADTFEIDLNFTMNGNDYKIIRKKSRKGDHELLLYMNGSNLTEKIVETQQKINNIIKMDYDTFMDTICIGQGQSGRFMKKKPNERKDVFVQVLNLDKYDKLKDYTNSLKKETKNKVDLIQLGISRYSEQLGLIDSWERNLIDIKNNVNLLNAKIKVKDEEYQNVLKERLEYENYIKTIEENRKQREELKRYKLQTLNQREKLNNKIKNFKTSLNEDEQKVVTLNERISKKEYIDIRIVELENKKLKLEESKSKLDNNVNTLSTQNIMFQKQIEELKKKYNDLKNYNQAQCQFCGNDITASHKEAHLEELRNNGKLLQSQINANTNETESLNNNLLSVNSELLSLKNELQDLQKKQNYIITAQSQVESLQENLESNKKYMLQAQEEYEDNLKINCIIEELKEENIQQKTFNDISIKREKELLENNYKNEIEKKAQIELKIKEIKHHQNKVDELSTQLEELKIEFSDYEDLEVAWGKAGIQAVIIENALPEIEMEINKILEVLCDGKVNIEFKTQKDTKGKKSKKPSSVETLDIIVNDEFGARTYETYSGGEQFRIDFACHVGLSKFLANRANANMDFFIVDEGLGAQDAISRSNVVTSINKLTGMFKQIFIITHIEEVQEAFHNKLIITKDPLNGSQVKYV